MIYNWTDEEKAEAVRLYTQEGKTLNELATAFRCTRGAIADMLESEGKL